LHAVKKIAILILLLFVVSQVLPTAQTLVNDTAIMLVDHAEEQKNSKDELKEKKEYKEYLVYSRPFSGAHTGLLLRWNNLENILPSPCVDKITPPPNFS
jgi:hypothetical protein